MNRRGKESGRQLLGPRLIGNASRPPAFAVRIEMSGPLPWIWENDRRMSAIMQAHLAAKRSITLSNLHFPLPVDLTRKNGVLSSHAGVSCRGLR